MTRKEIHPTFQGHPALSPQFLHGISKCVGRSLVIACSLRLVRKATRKSTLPRPAHLYRHYLHLPDDTPKSIELHRCSKMEHLICDTHLGQFCSVTSSQGRQTQHRGSEIVQCRASEGAPLCVARTKPRMASPARVFHGT